jgi:carbamate kinase
MVTTATINVPLPTELVKELESRAAKSGLDVPTYVALLARMHIRQHDPAFRDAARFVFAKFPDALKRLSQ